MITHKGHAIVIGAGAAGVLAARVLSEHFKTVTVLEKDSEMGDGLTIRKGIPQGNHVHNILYQGNKILIELFPELIDSDFDRALCPTLEISKDQRMLGPFGWNPTYATGLYLRGYSRAFLDHQLQKQLMQLSNVHLLLGQEAQGLIYDPLARRVQGIRMIQRGSSPDARVTELRADLVVDTSGRSTPVLKWLNSLGISSPRITRVKMSEGYATRVYQLAENVPAWKQFAIIRIPPLRNRGGYMLAIENRKWIVTLVGGEGDYPPHDESGFLEFARSLETRDIFDLIQRGVPQGPVLVFRKMDSTCAHLDEVPDWPSGLIGLGDSICTFNPVFGQGITTAALGAKYLQQKLKKSLSGSWEVSFHHGLLSLMESPWLYSVREELPRSPVERSNFISIRLQRLTKVLRQKILKLLFQAVPHDRKLHFKLFQVQNLILPMRSLWSPWLLGRALLVTWLHRMK